MSAHNGSAALIRSDAVMNVAQRSPSLLLGMRVKRREGGESLYRGLDREKSRNKMRELDKR